MDGCHHPRRHLPYPTLDNVSRGAEDVLNRMKAAWEDARQMTNHQTETMKKNADRLRRKELYLAGERVMLSSEDLSRGRGKLDNRFTGPLTRVGDSGVNVCGCRLLHDGGQERQPLSR